jgi:uncharacterized membrane protein
VAMGDGRESAESLAELLTAMQARLDALKPSHESLRAFLDTYRRTTMAVQSAIDSGRFEDPTWVEDWDVAFAQLYLNALDAELSGASDVPRPWRLAFDAPPTLPPLRHLLLGINAHINFDLPQALLAVIPDADFADPQALSRRQRDHERIDAVLSARVADEDNELESTSHVTFLDRVLRPANRLASRRFLREARQKVWHNTLEMQKARAAGPDQYAATLGELEVLSAAKIADLLAPGHVLLRLAVTGFGITLPPPSGDTAGA